jgi:hypothetical protein
MVGEEQDVQNDLSDLVCVAQGWNRYFMWTLGLPRGGSVKFLQEKIQTMEPFRKAGDFYEVNKHTSIMKRSFASISLDESAPGSSGRERNNTNKHTR